MKLEWPLVGLADDVGRSLGCACVQAPARTVAEAETIAALAASHPLLGFTSYMGFPADYRLPNGRDYESLCIAWCHCFREPREYFKHTLPLLLLSYSDFTDYSIASPLHLLGTERVDASFDFVYVCQAGRWKEQVKNWNLALRCLPVLCNDLGLQGILVGRRAIDGLTHDSTGITVVPELPWQELMRLIATSRFLFLPNELDASPRILCEALCMDTPVLVNRNILGGWKYVNPFTGAFFDNEHDVVQGAHYCLHQRTSPRRWYIANAGPLVSGRRLAQFLAAHDARFARIRRIRLTDMV